jgi:hypothetical protein
MQNGVIPSFFACRNASRVSFARLTRVAIFVIVSRPSESTIYKTRASVLFCELSRRVSDSGNEPACCSDN